MPTSARSSLVTGGAGFIGSHLVEALIARGDRVVVIDDESTGNRANLAAVAGHPRLRYVQGSVADGPLVDDVLNGVGGGGEGGAETGVDEIYHLAAAVGVALVAADPLRAIQTNVAPTEGLLAAVRRRHARGKQVRLFLSSSSEVYGKNPKPQWTEDDDLVFGPTVRARWSYGVSKAIDEFLVLAAWRQEQVPVVVGRLFNVVGPRQTGRYGMVLPRLVAAALAGRRPVVHDDGQQQRCFAHVTDVVRAILALMQTPSAVGGVFNIGSDQPVSIEDLARRVIEAVDPRLEIEYQSYAAAYSDDFEDVRRRVPDLSKLRKRIDFQLQADLNQIIAEVIAWQRGAGADREKGSR